MRNTDVTVVFSQMKDDHSYYEFIVTIGDHITSNAIDVVKNNCSEIELGKEYHIDGLLDKRKFRGKMLSIDMCNRLSSICDASEVVITDDDECYELVDVDKENPVSTLVDTVKSLDLDVLINHESGIYLWFENDHKASWGVGVSDLLSTLVKERIVRLIK